MKKILFPLGFAAILAATGCSEDFEVAAPYKNVAVVYGILDVKDTAHYIRIQKVFMDEKKSAIDMSKVPDSSYFKVGEIEANLIEMNGTNTVKTIPLTRVDMTAEGYPKDQPANTQGFYTMPHYAYKTAEALKPGTTYNLKVVNKTTGETIETQSAVGMVNSKESANQGDFYVNEFQRADYFINLERTQPINANQFQMRGRTPTFGAMQEGVMRFHYVDKNTVTGEQIDKSVDFNFGSATSAPNGVAFLFQRPNLDFYTFLADAIGPAPTNIERYMDSCDVFVWAASAELLRYQQVNQTQNSGISGDQIKPIYTNLKGNAIGILGSRTYVVFRNVPLGRSAGQSGIQANYTLDSIMTNSLTSKLNIRGRSDH
ncbi:MAG: hypothetical protein EOP51_00415 [Sphingobacteriales bacterium]|nr:MAG: hypothetical protein EOP51_00415 [Sphingobacteriales bacterium]